MKYLIVEPPKEELTGKSGWEKRNKLKSRSFAATLLGYVQADSVWANGNESREVVRPVFFMAAATEQQMNAFSANVRTGRKVILMNKDERYNNTEVSLNFEFLKSAGYKYFFQKIKGIEGANGEQVSVMTVYLPQVFNVDSLELDDDDCQFVSMPPVWWKNEQLPYIQENKKLCTELEKFGEVMKWEDKYQLSGSQIIDLVPQAVHFMKCLSSRTSIAIVSSVDFQVQVYLAMLNSGLATIPATREYMNYAKTSPYNAYVSESSIESCGFVYPVICNVSQNVLSQFIQEQVKVWKYGQERLDELLPYRVTEREEMRQIQSNLVNQLVSSSRDLKIEAGYLPEIENSSHFAHINHLEDAAHTIDLPAEPIKVKVISEPVEPTIIKAASVATNSSPAANKKVVVTIGEDIDLIGEKTINKPKVKSKHKPKPLIVLEPVGKNDKLKPRELKQYAMFDFGEEIELISA